MSFISFLQSAVEQTAGALSCTLMGFDGIPVEMYPTKSSSELAAYETTCVEYCELLSHARKAATLLRSGALLEMMLGAEKSTTLLRVVNAEYFLILHLKPEANVGQARFVLRVKASSLQNAM